MECGVTHHYAPSVTCTMPRGHEGPHRWKGAPRWESPPRNGLCGHGGHCVLSIDHWEAHRDKDGRQFKEP